MLAIPTNQGKTTPNPGLDNVLVSGEKDIQRDTLLRCQHLAVSGVGIVRPGW